MKQYDDQLTAYALGELDADELARFEAALAEKDDELDNELIAIGSLARMLEGAYAEADQALPSPDNNASWSGARRMWIAAAGAVVGLVLMLMLFLWMRTPPSPTLPRQAEEGAGALELGDSSTVDAGTAPQPKPTPAMRYAE